MRTSLNIARTELRTLFFSPIAWLVLVIFSFQCALSLIDNLSRMSADINAGMMAFNISGNLLAYFGGYFASVQKTVFLYLPLLTMGLISREISSGSIKLVFSSPVSSWQLISGKYIAMLFYCLLMTLMTVLAAIPAMIAIPHFDYGFIISGALSTLLLISAYAAIGLFMSSLTSYQVVAAISTMVLLGGLTYIGEVGQSRDVIRDITGFLSISGRGENLREGLFISSDLAYFLLIIAFFLTLSVMYLTWQQQAVSRLNRFLKICLLMGSLALAGYLSSRPTLTFYHDLTRTKQKTLSDAARHALMAATGPLKVTTYVNILDENFWSYESPEKRREDREFWAPYLRFRPDIRFEYVYYYGKLASASENYPGLSDLQIAEKKAEAYGISMRRISAAGDLPFKAMLESEGNRTLRVLERNGRMIPLRFIDYEMNANPNQQDMLDALSCLTQPQVQVGMLEGQGERGIIKEGDHDYKIPFSGLNTRMALVNHGFVFRTLKADLAIPDDIDILVIADPRTPFTPKEQAVIGDYIKSGRNLFIMAETEKEAVVNPLLAQLGLRLRPGIVVQRSADFPPAFVNQIVSPSARLLGYPALDKAIGGGVSTTGAGALELTNTAGFDAFPLLTTAAATSWYRGSRVLPDTGQVVFEPRLGDEQGQVVTAYGLKKSNKGKADQRIVAIADADLLTLAELYRSSGGPKYNFVILPAVFRYLSNGRFPKELTAVPPPDHTIETNKSQIFLFRVVFLGIIPVLLLILGTVLLIRRRGK